MEGVPFATRVCLHSGFAGLIRVRHFGRGKQVTAQTVSGTLTSIGQMVCLATNVNPTKVEGSHKFMPFLAQMLDGFHKAVLPTLKMLPGKVGVPEFLAGLG